MYCIDCSSILQDFRSRRLPPVAPGGSQWLPWAPMPAPPRPAETHRWGRDRAPRPSSGTPGPSSGTQRGPGGTTTIYTVLVSIQYIRTSTYILHSIHTTVLRVHTISVSAGLGGSRRVSVLTVFGTSASVPCRTDEGRVSKV